MKGSELLATLERSPKLPLEIRLPDGSFVASHFHITEVGRVDKKFIDCGGTLRNSIRCVLQVWVANDVDHRLDAGKLAQILRLADDAIGVLDHDVELECEHVHLSTFPLMSTQAALTSIVLQTEAKLAGCLAPDQCGVSDASAGCCGPTGCC